MADLTFMALLTTANTHSFTDAEKHLDAALIQARAEGAARRQAEIVAWLRSQTGRAAPLLPLLADQIEGGAWRDAPPRPERVCQCLRPASDPIHHVSSGHAYDPGPTCAAFEPTTLWPNTCNVCAGKKADHGAPPVEEPPKPPTCGHIWVVYSDVTSCGKCGIERPPKPPRRMQANPAVMWDSPHARQHDERAACVAIAPNCLPVDPTPEEQRP